MTFNGCSRHAGSLEDHVQKHLQQSSGPYGSLLRSTYGSYIIHSSPIVKGLFTGKKENLKRLLQGVGGAGGDLSGNTFFYIFEDRKKLSVVLTYDQL